MRPGGGGLATAAWQDRFTRWGWMWWAPPGFVMVGVSLLTLAVLQQRIDRAWDELSGAYADDLDALERTFGLHLRSHHPEARSHHAKGSLEFATGSGDRLVLDLEEPTRNRYGWGGAHMRAWRKGQSVRLRCPDLYLTFARGLHPEWVARWPGFPPRMALVNDAFVAEVAAAAFGPPEAPAGSGPS